MHGHRRKSTRSLAVHARLQIGQLSTRALETGFRDGLPQVEGYGVDGTAVVGGTSGSVGTSSGSGATSGVGSTGASSSRGSGGASGARPPAAGRPGSRRS